MIKKAGYILLTTLLIISTVGFVVSRHYCNQILVSVALDVPAEPCGDANDMGADCCHDVNEYVILKIDFVQPAAGQINVAVVDLFNAELTSVLVEPSTENTNSNHLSQTILKPGKINSLVLIQSFLL